jgi:hypothetical protein
MSLLPNGGRDNGSRVTTGKMQWPKCNINKSYDLSFSRNLLIIHQPYFLLVHQIQKVL